MTEEKRYIHYSPLSNFTITELSLEYLSRNDLTKEAYEQILQELRRGIEITDDVMLRLPSNEELDFLKESFNDILLNRGVHIQAYTSIMITRSKDWLNQDKLSDDALLAFRLYKEGDIFSQVSWYGDNQHYVSSLSAPLKPMGPLTIVPKSYTINMGEIGEIRPILEKIRRIDFIKERQLRIALDRFTRSYEERRADDRIIDYAIAFEALYLRKAKQPAISAGEIVGLGCSMLLGKTQDERDKINEFIVKAFSIRNKIVHGLNFDESIEICMQKFDIETFSEELRKYLRESIKKLISTY